MKRRQRVVTAREAALVIFLAMVAGACAVEPPRDEASAFLDALVESVSPDPYLVLYLEVQAIWADDLVDAIRGDWDAAALARVILWWSDGTAATGLNQPVTVEPPAAGSPALAGPRGSQVFAMWQNGAITSAPGPFTSGTLKAALDAVAGDVTPSDARARFLVNLRELLLRTQPKTVQPGDRLAFFNRVCNQCQDGAAFQALRDEALSPTAPRTVVFLPMTYKNVTTALQENPPPRLELVPYDARRQPMRATLFLIEFHNVQLPWIFVVEEDHTGGLGLAEPEELAAGR